MKVTSLCPLALSVVALPVFGQQIFPQPVIPVAAVTSAHAYTTSGIFRDDDGNQASSSGAPVSSTPGKLPDTVAYQPLTVKQKFIRSTKGTFGPAALLFDAVGAGYEQLTNSPGPWGQGAEAFGLRYASTFGINFVNQYAGFAIASALHEDPRYFPSLDRSAKARIKNAFKQVVVTKTDSGGSQFAYAKIGGALAGGFAANAWLPNTDNSVGDAFETTAVLIGLNTAFNLAQEFVPFFRHIQ